MKNSEHTQRPKKIKESSIIVTGGLGFLGFHLTKKLINAGYYPIVIDDLSNSNKERLSEFSDKITFIKSDICDEKIILSKIKSKKLKPKIIIHLAAKHFIPDCIKDPDETMRVNVEGTRSILEIGLKLKIKKVIFASSAAVYKSSKKKHKESDALKHADIYGLSKITSEEVISSYSRKYGFKYLILRLFNIYGPGDLTPHLIPSLAYRFKHDNFIRVGNTNTLRDYVYVDDVADAFLLGVKKNNQFTKNMVYNVGSGKETSVIKSL